MFMNSTRLVLISMVFLGWMVQGCATLPESTGGRELRPILEIPDGEGDETAHLQVVGDLPLNLSCVFGQAASGYLVVGNIGETSLAYDSSSSLTYLTLAPAQAEVQANEEVSVLVEIDCADLALGSHEEQIGFSAGEALGSPQVIDVVINVTDTPEPSDLVISASFSSINCVDDEVFLESLVVNNGGGGGPLNWISEVTSEAPWLVLSAASGTTPSVVQLTVDCTAVESGSFSTELVVTASGGEEERVTLGIEESWLGHDPVIISTAHDGMIVEATQLPGGGPMCGYVSADDSGDGFWVGSRRVACVFRGTAFFRFDLTPYDSSEISSMTLKLQVSDRGGDDTSEALFLANLPEDYETFDVSVRDMPVEYDDLSFIYTQVGVVDYELDVTDSMLDGATSFSLGGPWDEDDDNYFSFADGARLEIEFLP